MIPKPFRIEVPEDALDDLRARLVRTRWPDEVAGAGWDYGTNLTYLKNLVGYWEHTFDWRKQERMLNQFAHFRAEVNGFGLHFVHERGKGPDPIPLLLLHGWPDSFYRFYKLIPMLIDPGRYGGDPETSFDVIVPSLPGFGFSDKPLQRGGVDDAALVVQLMTDVLGYERFAVQGGDAGALLARDIASRYPQSVVGIHLTDIGYDATYGLNPSTLTLPEQEFVAALERWSSKEGAYFMIQGTKPQTLAYGLTDSPVGLAAWIVEKFRAWSDCDGDVERRFSKDELLTNIMIYWLTGTINSSIRVYYEGMNVDWDAADAGGDWGGAEMEEPWGALTGAPDSVPVGVALFPKDIPGAPLPRELAERTLNIRQWTKMPRGGHFAALEEPELLADDIRTFLNSFR